MTGGFTQSGETRSDLSPIPDPRQLADPGFFFAGDQISPPAEAPSGKTALAFNDETAGTRASGSDSAEVAKKLPSHETGPADRIWDEFFSNHTASEEAVRRSVLRLTTLGEHEHVVYLIQAALIHGQTQPWMYEVLADSMKLADRPESEIQRVILSLTDFGTANLESMMISGAYLARFGRDDAALRMYRQAARIAPERAEPYILGLRLARKLKRPDDVQWAVTGVLEYGWTEDHEALHREATNAALEAEDWLARDGKPEAVKELKQAVARARRCDLKITITWNGTADLDLFVEEPTGTVCSFEAPETIGGGIHLHDGYGPIAENCIETYVCPRAVSGDYRIRISHVFGDVVGRRAQVEIAMHVGDEKQAVKKQTVQLTGEDAVMAFTLEGGRRDRPRAVSSRWLRPLADWKSVQAAPMPREGELTAEEEAVLARFRQGRQLSIHQVSAQTISTQTTRPFVTGAVGFQPVVTNISEGSRLNANAVVSPDRRYVRIAVNPYFSTLTDVFTFSFVSGVDPFGGRNTGLGGN